MDSPTRAGRSPLHEPEPCNPDGRPYFRNFDPTGVPSPAFVVDRAAVEHNLQILRHTADASGARMLLALKAFALPGMMDLVDRYLDGACASGVYEARLSRETLSGSVHSFAPAYSARDLALLLQLSDHISFNSLRHWVDHRDRPGAPILHPHGGASFGLRVNPEHSTGTVGIYDPCAPFSRLGITRTQLDAEAAGSPEAWAGISGLHMHTLCESDAAALAETVAALESRFGDILSRPEITWLNLGGGHHITRPDYDRDRLIRIVRRLGRRYKLQIILEPGEAAVIHSGVLVATVLDLPRNGMDLAILDTSATAHMPDTLEMPYRPEIWGASPPGAAAYTYRLGGQTCLAGDVIGDYSFDHPLQVGDRLVFDDMSHYTMVKTTTFNGIPLPSICAYDSHSGQLTPLRTPSYEDFRNRLGDSGDTNPAPVRLETDG